MSSRLPDDHPLKRYRPPDDVDCIADVPERVLNDLILYHNGDEPEGEPIPEDVKLA